MARLSKKQRAFIDHYLVCWNSAEAARQAGYSEKTARSIGAENLTKPYIKEEIDRRIQERAMSADEVLTRMADLARGDLSRYILSNGEIDIELLKADDMGHLLKKYKKITKRTVTKDGREFETEIYEMELYPADNALDKLMRYYGLYTDKVDVTSGGEPVQPLIYIPDNGRKESGGN